MYSLRMIFFGATNFGHSMTIIQALTYVTLELVVMRQNIIKIYMHG
jgi:hypothetical protein